MRDTNGSQLEWNIWLDTDMIIALTVNTNWKGLKQYARHAKETYLVCPPKSFKSRKRLQKLSKKLNPKFERQYLLKVI
jgi:hypothetical protein